MEALCQRGLSLLSKQCAAKQLLLSPQCNSTVSRTVAAADASLLCTSAPHWSPQHLASSVSQYRHYSGLQQVISQLQLPQLNAVPLLVGSISSRAPRDSRSNLTRQYAATSSAGEPGSTQNSRSPPGSSAADIGAAKFGVTSDSSSSSSSAAGDTRAGGDVGSAKPDVPPGVAAEPDVTSISSSSSAAGDTRAGGDAGNAKPDVPPGVAAAAGATGKTAARATKAVTKGMSKILKLIQQTPTLHTAHLQLSSLWQSHAPAITTVAAAAATAGLYKIIHMAAGTVLDVSSTEAMWVCAAAAATAVGGTGFYIRSGLVVDPERVYQVAMRKLTRHAGLQEVMGTPLAGSPMRVQLITRGSYFISESLMPRRRAPRIHMLFPLSGPLKSGVVSLEAKRVPSRKYAFRNLTVELPSKGLTAAAAAARAAAAGVGQQSSAADGSSLPGAAALDSSSSSGVSSSSDGGGVKLDADQQVDAARVYIVGGTQHGIVSGTDISSSSGSAATDSGSYDAAAAAAASSKQVVPSATVLLEQLKHPLMLALQQNIVVSETEDELADLQGYDVSTLDPDQMTIWDHTKLSVAAVARGGVYYGKVAGCKVVGFVRRLLATARKAAKKREATAAAAAATTTTTAKAEPSVQVPDAVVAEGTLTRAASGSDPAVAPSAAAAVVLKEATAIPPAAAEREPAKPAQVYDLHHAQEAAAIKAVQKAAEEIAAKQESMGSSASSSSSGQGSTGPAGDGPQKQ